MADLVFLALAIGFFAIAAAYIRGCAAVAKIDDTAGLSAGGDDGDNNADENSGRGDSGSGTVDNEAVAAR